MWKTALMMKSFMAEENQRIKHMRVNHKSLALISMDPMSPLGKRLCELSDKAAAEGVRPLTQKQIRKRLSQARGGA